MNRFRSHEDGFTLIELLVVVAIAGIAAAIVVPAFLSQQKQSIRAGVEDDVHILNMAVTRYLVSNPEAVNLQWRKDGYEDASGLLALDDQLELGVGFAFTDKNTIARISLSTDNTDPGNSQQYAVVASNRTADTSGPWRFHFDSKSGEYASENE